MWLSLMLGKKIATTWLYKAEKIGENVSVHSSRYWPRAIL